MSRVRLIELIEAEAERLSPEGRELWEDWEFLLESAPGMESRMAREYEISERIFELPVAEQGTISRLTELLTGLRDSDEAGGRGIGGGVSSSRRYPRRLVKGSGRRSKAGPGHDAGPSARPAEGARLAPISTGPREARQSPRLVHRGLLKIFGCPYLTRRV